MGAPGFWNDQQQAQAVVQQVKAAKGWVDPYDTISGRVTSARELDEMLAAEPDTDLNRRGRSRDAGARGRDRAVPSPLAALRT